MKSLLFVLLTLIGTSVASLSPELLSSQSNKCVQFSVAPGTGCEWMCNYCANQLSTNNYYFTDDVCTYQQGQGCMGNPIAGKMYACCSAGNGKKDKTKKEKVEKVKEKVEKVETEQTSEKKNKKEKVEKVEKVKTKKVEKVKTKKVEKVKTKKVEKVKEKVETEQTSEKNNKKEKVKEKNEKTKKEKVDQKNE
jgi:hypothetical protein